MKIWRLFSLGVLLASLITVNAEAEGDFRCRIDGDLAPQWVCMGFFGNYVSGVGQGLTPDEAMQSAKESLSQSIASLMKARVRNYYFTLGAYKVDKSINKQIFKDSKRMAKEGKFLKYYQHEKNKSIYVLMGVSESTVDKAAKKYMKKIK